MADSVPTASPAAAPGPLDRLLGLFSDVRVREAIVASLKGEGR